MADVKHEQSTYLSDFARFEKNGASNGRSGMHQVRKSAMSCFSELGFPTLRHEEWRFTNVAPIAQRVFELADSDDSVTLEKVRDLVPGLDLGQRLVFINGRFAANLSSCDGALVQSLAVVLERHPERVEPYLARYAKYDQQPFTALNTAFLHDGACIMIPAGKVIEQPIHLVHVSSARSGPSVSHPRALIVAGRSSQATVIESYVGLEGVYFTNAVTEVILGENAVLDHYKLQEESKDAFHIATLQIHLDRASNFSSHTVALGGALVRNDVNAVLDAEGCTCTLNGLSLAAGKQLIDNHTLIDHAKPHCTSHELYKSILDDQARGVFNGKIFVRPDAQKTDAKQTNQTLLLSSDATIDTKPQLEIFADDVRCTHGATVGQLDEAAIFYVRSRGIGLEQARSLLTFAFANDIVSRIKPEPIRAHLETSLLASQHLSTSEKGDAALFPSS